VQLWPLTLNRTEDFWQVLYALSPLEQAVVCQRLGVVEAFNPKHCSLHWVLDLTSPGDEEVAKKLVAMAVASGPELPSFYNLRIKGEHLHDTAGAWQAGGMHALQTSSSGQTGCASGGLDLSPHNNQDM